MATFQWEGKTREGVVKRGVLIADSNEVVRRRPDIIVGSWCEKKFRPESVAARCGWQEVQAVRNVHVVPAQSVVRQSSSRVRPDFSRVGQTTRE